MLFNRLFFYFVLQLYLLIALFSICYNCFFLFNFKSFNILAQNKNQSVLIFKYKFIKSNINDLFFSQSQKQQKSFRNKLNNTISTHNQRKKKY